MLVTPGVLPSGRALAGGWVLCCTHLFLYGRLLLVPCRLLAALSPLLLFRRWLCVTCRPRFVL